jgi:hypothetical protein
MPEDRVRPSLVGTPASKILAGVAQGTRVVLGEEHLKILMTGIEKGMQDEHDDQLRNLND